MILTHAAPTAIDLLPAVNRAFGLAAGKIARLHARWSATDGAPVFTWEGRYTSRGWTEWTQGFQFGMPLLVFDATGDAAMLEIGRRGTLERMAPHLTHTGVHDHGFNNISTYGHLLRLALDGRFDASPGEMDFFRLALRVSGAVQASRWTSIPDGGFIHSFNGPHSLFADTIRSLRSLAVAHLLGHVLLGEGDRRIGLLERLLQHAATTARFSVYYGEGRDAFDVRGRVAHESIFNVTDGAYRCPGTQQGWSPFSTWTRGLAWILCGFAELLEFISILPDADLAPHGGRASVTTALLHPALAVADYHLASTPACGVPYWDTGAPGLARLEGWADRPADPFNDHEPVDSSAAAISAQGLIRLGLWLKSADRDRQAAKRFLAAGFATARTLFADPYLSPDPDHEGLLLHAVYHRPNGWDRIPPGRRIPCGEACLWGDYHALELALLVHRLAGGARPPVFFPR